MASLPPLFNTKFFDGEAVASAYRLWTFVSGTTTPKAAYKTAAQDAGNTHTNPIILDSDGAPPVGLRLDSGPYTLRLETPDGGVVDTWDNVEDIDSLIASAIVSGASATTQTETVSASAGETVITLPALRYTPSVGGLAVYAGGLYLTSGVDYTETDSSSITLSGPLAADTTFVFVSGRLVTSGVEMQQVSPGLAEDTAGGPADEASYHFRRRANYGGGTPGYVNSALRVDTFVESAIGSEASTASSFEWALCSVVHNYSSAGENVGGYLQGRKYSTGPTWGGTIEVIEYLGANPTSGTVAVELNVTANGTDSGGSRVGSDLSIRRRDSGGAAISIGWGYRIQGDSGASVDRGFGFVSGLTVNKGFDASTATVVTAAFMMAENQVIAFNADGDRQMTHNGSGWLLKDNASTTHWNFADNGAMIVLGTQITGSRRTGWTLPTGTLSRSTFDPSTVTTEQLAQRVAALITDLHGTAGHGLIGT